MGASKRKMLECCICHTPALPATGRLEHDARRCAWFDGDSGECPKCGTALRVLIDPDYAEDQVARVVTEGHWRAEERYRNAVRSISDIRIEAARHKSDLQLLARLRSHPARGELFEHILGDFEGLETDIAQAAELVLQLLRGDTGQGGE